MQHNGNNTTPYKQDTARKFQCGQHTTYCIVCSVCSEAHYTLERRKKAAILKLTLNGKHFYVCNSVQKCAEVTRESLWQHIYLPYVNEKGENFKVSNYFCFVKIYSDALQDTKQFYRLIGLHFVAAKQSNFFIYNTKQRITNTFYVKVFLPIDI